MGHEELFGDFLQRVSEKMPAVSKAPYVNINGKLFYNPFDSTRRLEKENYNLGELQSKGILVENPQCLFITDKNLKDELKILLKVDWFLSSKPKYMLFYSKSILRTCIKNMINTFILRSWESKAFSQLADIILDVLLQLFLLDVASCLYSCNMYQFSFSTFLSIYLFHTGQIVQGF